MAALHLVSTPIGNLGDFTFRAVEVLRAADVVLAEDTRRSRVLLRHYGVDARMVSAHEHNEAARAVTVVEMLREGKQVALLTDAGTPLLSDPGARIVRAVLNAGFAVVPIPGASALLAALVASGISADRFVFYGFIPRRGGKRSELLEEMARSAYTSVLYESPHRTAELLGDLQAVAGAGRRVTVARELTKIHEEFFRGTLEEGVARFGNVEVRGEIVVVLEGRGEEEAAEEAAVTDALAARSLAEALIAQGMPPSAAARELRRRLGIPRNAAYALLQALTGERER
ncbi:MAG: 16S rRNA (cytidine(1402)-2'-O)-methyltransferase [Gemmatimonadota bacterium]|nr:16S rRNA (cytidine(1402)-2'-O)-methyltransferase [Gemmatimonadota bacterium]